MEDTKIVINSLRFSLAAGVILLGLFALDGLYTLFVLPFAMILSGFNETRALATLDYSPGKWSEAYWEKTKSAWPKKFL